MNLNDKTFNNAKLAKELAIDTHVLAHKVEDGLKGHNNATIERARVIAWELTKLANELSLLAHDLRDDYGNGYAIMMLKD